MKCTFKLARVEARIFPEAGEVVLLKFVPFPAGIGDLVLTVPAKDAEIVYHPETRIPIDQRQPDATRVHLKAGEHPYGVKTGGETFMVEDVVTLDVAVDSAATAALAAETAEKVKAAKLASLGL